MKNIFSVLSLIFFLVSISFIQAQTDTVKTDKVYMLDGSTMDGKVKTVKNDIVVFTDKETGVDYEIKKSDIKVIILASGKPIIFTENTEVSKNVYPPPATQSPTTPPAVTPPGFETQFGLSAKVAIGLASWNDLQTDDSKLGFGINGDLLAGVLLDEMFFGIGPHLAYNVWSTSKTYSGYTATASTSVSDFGLSFGGAWDGFYVLLGFGSGNVTISAELGGDSQSYDLPESIGYTRVEFGWYDGYLIGIAFQNYSDDEIPNNLNRIEFLVGWVF